MPVRTAPGPAGPRPAEPRPAAPRPAAVRTPDPRDTALDEAYEHIADLAERIWAVRRLHRPVAVRTLLGTSVRCPACGQAAPCATARAVDAAA